LAENDTPVADAAPEDAVRDMEFPPHTEGFRERGEELAEKPSADKVQAAVREQLTADTSQQEAKAKVRQVDASPDAGSTPSGVALKEVAGISDDAKRGEAYQRERAKVRHGYGGDE
jgi:hypothetical protein